MNRRQFLGGTAAIGAGLAGLYAWNRVDNFAYANIGKMPRLAMPKLLDATENRTAKLVAQKGSSVFKGQAANETYGFNQPYLGPTLRVSKGDFNPIIENQIPTPISVHWHGLLIPGAHDGGPHLPIAKGEEWAPKMQVDQPPATLWYHTHIHKRTGHDVHKGLAGILQISDGRDDERGLPNDYGVDDLTLVLQDRRMDDQGFVSYQPAMPDYMHGFTGNAMLVNGQYGSVAVAPKSIVRLRLINGSNARIYALHFEDERAFQLIATDSGYLENPLMMTKLPLSPGERAEILVDFSSGKPALLKSDADPNQGPGGMMGNMMGRMRGMVDAVFDRSIDILSFAVDERVRPRITKFADKLDGPAFNLRREDVVKTRTFIMDLMGGTEGFSINNRRFDMGRIDLDVALGSTEIWRVGSHMLAHPFHVHGAVFQVLSEGQSLPRPHNLGFKDTVLVGEEVELLIRFDHPASKEHPFMYHCHILEHEDAGMMGQFTVS